MSENDKNKKDGSFDLMQDTQYLLQGLEDSEEESYSLADILAEFGSEEAAAETWAAEHPKIITFPGAAAAEEPAESNSREEDEIPPEMLFSAADEVVLPDEPELPELESQESEPQEAEEPSAPAPLTMEDIVASTVDAVKAENERDQSEQRRRIEKERKRREKRRREPRVNAPLPESREEKPLKELIGFHKRRYLNCRMRLLFAVPVLLGLWIVWLMAENGTVIPFFSESAGNAAVCVLAAQALLCVICAPLFAAAVEELKERCCTFYTYTALVNLVTLLDEITMLVLPGRSAAAPLGGVAGCALVFSLWGLKNYHGGMWETFRTAAMGRPSSVVDCCSAGIAKGVGSSEDFVKRANMESTASQWQRLFLPLLSAASMVFALVSSVGQLRSHDFLWCWSLILCASCSLVCPLSYCVPFGSIARRLSRSGAAVAGQYGAAALYTASALVVTDLDLFPRTAVALNGIKLYGEKRERAISYAATLAVQGGGCLGQEFESLCQAERLPYEPLEHFHIHEDGGLSGMIRGETVLVGTPVFMRHTAVRLPASFPFKTAVCLAVDGELTAIFSVKYTAHPPVETAMRALSRNGLSLVLASRDGNITPKLLKNRFGTDGKATRPESTEYLSLSDPMREGGAPNGVLYREGLLPYVELAALSRRLCQLVRVGNLLSLFGASVGALLAFYLSFVGTMAVLTPTMILTFLLLWVVPMLPLLFGVDRI